MQNIIVLLCGSASNSNARLICVNQFGFPDGNINLIIAIKKK